MLLARMAFLYLLLFSTYVFLLIPALTSAKPYDDWILEHMALSKEKFSDEQIRCLEALLTLVTGCGLLYALTVASPLTPPFIISRAIVISEQ